MHDENWHILEPIWSCGPVLTTALVDILETTVNEDDDDDDGNTGEEDDEYGLFDNDDDE